MTELDFEALFAASPNPYVLLDPAFDLVAMNDAYLRVTMRKRDELVGRNVIAGRWTFQVVEEYDDEYWSLFRDLERTARDELAGGVRHLYEARLKEFERTVGEPGHEATPPER